MTSLYGTIPQPAIIEELEVKLDNLAVVKSNSYEILAESFQNNEKKTILINGIENVFKEIKLLFEMNYRIIKIKKPL